MATRKRNTTEPSALGEVVDLIDWLRALGPHLCTVLTLKPRGGSFAQKE